MCEICDAIKNSSGGTETTAIAVQPNGTVIVASKQHKRFTDLPASEQQELMLTANQVSVVLYESMQAHGTNIIVEDREHAHYQVINRTENDGIPLKWEGQRASPGELQATAKKISDAAWTIGKKDFNETSNPVIEERRAAKLAEEPEAVPIKKPEEKIIRKEENKPDLGDVASDIQHKTEKGPTQERDYRIRHLTRRR